MSSTLTYQQLNQALGNIDIYLLDQILKGRFDPGMRILDAGCGEGRNLPYFIQNGYEVWGIDRNPAAIRMLQMMGRSMHPAFDPDRFMTGELTELPFPPESFDAVICSAVLHFAPSLEAFTALMEEMLRVLRPQGLLFVRTATTYGMETGLTDLGGHRYRLKSGDELFLVSRSMIKQLAGKYKLALIEPFKTVVVDELRSMSVLVLRKTAGQ